MVLTLESWKSFHIWIWTSLDMASCLIKLINTHDRGFEKKKKKKKKTHKKHNLGIILKFGGDVSLPKPYLVSVPEHIW